MGHEREIASQVSEIVRCVVLAVAELGPLLPAGWRVAFGFRGSYPVKAPAAVRLFRLCAGLLSGGVGLLLAFWA